MSILKFWNSPYTQGHLVGRVVSTLADGEFWGGGMEQETVVLALVPCRLSYKNLFLGT